jgi:hypothetical protein
VTRAEEFDDLRPLLFAIAYRMLGSVSPLSKDCGPRPAIGASSTLTKPGGDATRSV